MIVISYYKIVTSISNFQQSPFLENNNLQRLPDLEKQHELWIGIPVHPLLCVDRVQIQKDREILSQSLLANS